MQRQGCDFAEDDQADRQASDFAGVLAWAATLGAGEGLLTVGTDEDGAIHILPSRADDPALVIMAGDDGYEVLICDPDHPEQYGPFVCLDAALEAISDGLGHRP